MENLHIRNKNTVSKMIGKCSVNICFSNEKNTKVKDIILEALLNSYENRIQDYKKII